MLCAAASGRVAPLDQGRLLQLCPLMVPPLSYGCPSPPLAGECVCLGRLFLSCRAAAPQFSRRSVDARRRRSRVSACVSRLSLSCRAAAPQVRHCCAVGAQCRWCLLRAAALSVSRAPPSVPPPSVERPPQCFPSAAVLPPLSTQTGCLSGSTTPRHLLVATPGDRHAEEHRPT